jgi:hypothetical protein
MSESQAAFEGWSILELMGHRKLGGYARVQEVAGVPFLRIDVPSDPPVTQFYAPAAIYALTPTTETLARAFASTLRPAPVTRWELPEPRQPAGPDGDGEGDRYEDR